MNVLFVTPYLPFPPVSGGRLQTFLRMKHLRARGHAVFLMTLALQQDFGNITELKKLIDDVGCVFVRPDLTKLKGLFRKSLLYEIFTLDRRFGKAASLFAGRNAIDVAVFEGLGTAQYRDWIPRIPSVLYQHNVEHEITGQLAAYVRRSPLKLVKGGAGEVMRNLYLWFFGRKETELVRIFESGSLNKFDRVVACSERDADILRKEAPGTSIVTIPWAVRRPEGFWQPGEKGVRDLVFVGSMTWEPNRDAVLWFANEIFPLLRKSRVKTRLVIAGSGMTKEVACLDNGSDIIVKGFVPDIAGFLLDADVFVAPLRLGSGVNVKVLEAMACGLPVVTTPKGAEGIGTGDGGYFAVASTPEEFVHAVESLLRNRDSARSMGTKAREYIAAHHDIDAVIGAFEEVLSDGMKEAKARGGVG
jgi:glycosyltransferase involved in cell wall biosynthesis